MTVAHHPKIPGYASAWYGKQDFRRTDFGSRLLAAEGEGGGGREGEGAEDRCG